MYPTIKGRSDNADLRLTQRLRRLPNNRTQNNLVEKVKLCHSDSSVTSFLGVMNITEDRMMRFICIGAFRLNLLKLLSYGKIM